MRGGITDGCVVRGTRGGRTLSTAAAPAGVRGLKVYIVSRACLPVAKVLI